MRKLESDIKRATKEYEKARDALQSLVDLKEVERMDEQGIKPNLQNVMQYGAYIHGVQMACNKIRNDYFKGDNANSIGKKNNRLIFEAILEKVLESKLDAERWIGDKNYLSNDYTREIAFNVIGDIIADNLSPEVVENVKSQFGMK